MKKYKIISWNVNGLRAVISKGIEDFLNTYNPSILCLQEIKATEDQVSKILPNFLNEYNKVYSSGIRKGYSGVATFSKENPNSASIGLKNNIDDEGRVIKSTYDDFILYNIYFPNGKKDKDRLNYKMNFYKDLIEILKNHKKNNDKVIILGDYNTAHKEIDLARPKENSKISGFLPEERVLIDDILNIGYIDTLREFNNQENIYTWWDPITKARERNVGWRIDYIFVSENLKKNLISSDVLDKVYGSDHCPVSIDIEI